MNSTLNFGLILLGYLIIGISACAAAHGMMYMEFNHPEWADAIFLFVGEAFVAYVIAVLAIGVKRQIQQNKRIKI